MKILEDLYAYPWRGNDNNCNSYLLAGALNENRHVIIDPGHLLTPMYREPGLERLLGEMQRDGIDGSRIGLVILTHGHPDHCEAAMALRSEFHALVAMHEEDAPAYSGMGGKVDVFLDEGSLELRPNKPVHLEIYHSPGHTPGHVTVYWVDKKVLAAGDCVFYRSMGRTDFPGGDPRALQKSIERLSKLDIEYLLCGHAYGNSGVLKGREEVNENFRILENYFNMEAL
jgi:glyoxylase-like metal-dependent hydrolase (beta-lactamase superfamily II)